MVLKRFDDALQLLQIGASVEVSAKDLGPGDLQNLANVTTWAQGHLTIRDSERLGSLDRHNIATVARHNVTFA